MKYFMIFIMAAFFICCERSLNNPSDKQKSILGEWVWVKTVLVNWDGETTTTPETEGFSRTWKFSPDSLFEAFRDDEPTFRSKYWLDARRDALGNATTDTLLFILGWTPLTFTLSVDELVVSSAYVDGPTEYFIKK